MRSRPAARAGLLAALAALVAVVPAAGQSPPLAAGGGGLAAAALGSCETDLRLLNQISGWAVRWPGEWRALAVGSPEERAAALTRWAPAAGLLDADVAALREGIAAGRTAPRAVVRRVLDQVDGILAAAEAGSPPAPGSALSPAARAADPAFRERWTRLVRAELLPAIRRYRDFLAGTYLPAAREAPGLSAIPGGKRCWLDAVESWTTLRLSGPEIERRGRAYLAEVEAELDATAPGDLETILDRLREGDFPDGFETREDVVERSRRAIERAVAAAPEWFATPGENRIEVVPIDASLEESFPAGFYQPPSGGGAPARYFVNTSHPASRRLMSEAIAFHETVPGHHTSFAVAVAHGSDPRAGFNSGFAEGWALYAERLADEMGLYSTALDRQGLLAKHLWAASRLVFEPGIHLHGWSRRRAIDYLTAHSALSPREAAVEVDRVIALPGQSLSYVLGYLELRDMRRRAETALGDRFDVRAFHDVVLAGGIRPLADVRRDVEAWVARRGADGTVAGGPRPSP